MRTATCNRKTAETDITLALDLDGTGKSEIDSGVGFLNHMLTLLARHARMDMILRCAGDTQVDDHHSVEDIGIALGEALKAALGGVSYLIHGLMRMDTLKPDRCEIHGEDFQWQGDALVIGIGNGRQAGGGQQLCPEALINDGQLQLRIFTGDGLLPALFTTLTQPEESPNIIAGKSAWFEVNAPHGMTFNLDGEPLSGTQFRIEVLPGALQCRLPPDCVLLR